MKNLEITIFIQSLFVKIFDFIFPPSPAELVLRNVNSVLLKSLYQPNQKENIIYLSEYRETIIQTAITTNKFHANVSASKILAGLLDIWIEKQTAPSVYIPIPLSQNRLRERGHNQVETVLRASNLKLDIRTDLLKRIKDTTPQTKLHKSEREKNLVGAFAVTEKIKSLPENLQIILVDDVITTGTTLLEAKQTLKKYLPAHIKIICLAIAH
jgi:ComF family protein